MIFLLYSIGVIGLFYPHPLACGYLALADNIDEGV